MSRFFFLPSPSSSSPSLSRKPLAFPPHVTFFRSSFSLRSCSSLLFHPSLSLSLLLPPLLFAHVFRMLLRAVATAENTTTDQLCPEDVERGRNLQLGNLNQPFRSPYGDANYHISYYLHTKRIKCPHGHALRWIMK